MNFNGILIGAATFLIIGVCHPLVIKAEYYFGKKSWMAFLACGLCLAALSVMLENDILSTVAGAAAFSFFWGIGEVLKQEERVLKGWFPENPKRKAYYDRRRKEQAVTVSDCKSKSK